MSGLNKAKKLGYDPEKDKYPLDKEFRRKGDCGWCDRKTHLATLVLLDTGDSREPFRWDAACHVCVLVYNVSLSPQTYEGTDKSYEWTDMGIPIKVRDI